MIYHFCTLNRADPALVRAVETIGIFYTCAVIIRLARFNVQTSNEDSHTGFMGLPSPAAAAMVASFPIALEWIKAHNAKEMILPFDFQIILVCISLTVALLMVSSLKYTHFFNKLVMGARPITNLLELAMIIVMVVIFRECAFFLVFLSYVIAGPLISVKNRIKSKKVVTNDESLRQPGI